MKRRRELRPGTPPSDGLLLTRALGLDPVRSDALEVQLGIVGGLGALWRSGGAGLLPTGDPAESRLWALVELQRRARMEPRPTDVIDGPEAVQALLEGAGFLRQEAFWVVLLDVRGHPLGVEQVAQGTLTSCLVHPREVFAPAIAARAAAVVVAHNHPSGHLSPSPEDVELTARLVRAGALVGIPVLDHVVLAGSHVCSLGTEYLPDE